ncbi:MAG: hypothetical protein Q7J25_07810 [Vicinamibacterales bacterium]|nr:hypothetical protein [Vicinamibacterales bacterium]
MVTNFPRLFVKPDEFTSRPDETSRVEGFGELVLDRVREAFCGLHGHDSLLQFQQDRMFLKCVSCGHESPGWELNQTPPTVVARANRRRRTLAPPQFIGERRIAC